LKPILEHRIPGRGYFKWKSPDPLSDVVAGSSSIVETRCANDGDGPRRFQVWRAVGLGIRFAEPDGPVRHAHVLRRPDGTHVAVGDLTLFSTEELAAMVNGDIP
jgi:hypothetical protein